MLKSLAVKVVMGILGLAAVVAWWMLKAKFSDDNPSREGIPTVVWEGGTPVTVEVTLSHDGVVSAVFEKLSVGDEGHAFMEAWQKVSAGKHSFTISVPPQTSGNVEVRIDSPPVGAKVSVLVRNPGGELRDTLELSKPYEEGDGFTAHVELDDWLTGHSTESAPNAPP